MATRHFAVGEETTNAHNTMKLTVEDAMRHAANGNHARAATCWRIVAVLAPLLEADAKRSLSDQCAALAAAVEANDAARGGAR
jgi:hypothetical protein